MPDAKYNFSGRDYSATFERLLQLLVSDVPELTDLNHSDAGISIIRLVARDSDQLAFYLDEAFAEGYIPTARYKQSLCDLAKLTGYPPKLASAASTTLTLTRINGVSGDISIPKWSSFSRTDGQSYVTLANYTLLAANETIDVEVYEGVHIQEVVSEGEWVQPDLSGLWKYNLGADVADGSVFGRNKSLSGVPSIPITISSLNSTRISTTETLIRFSSFSEVLVSRLRI